MVSSFEVLRGGLRFGSVEVMRRGLMTDFDYSGAAPDGGIYRLAAICGGTAVPLGVAVPHDGALRFRKSFSPNALRTLGYTEPESFTLIRSDETSPTATPCTTDTSPEPIEEKPAPLQLNAVEVGAKSTPETPLPSDSHSLAVEVGVERESSSSAIPAEVIESIADAKSIIAAAVAAQSAMPKSLTPPLPAEPPHTAPTSTKQMIAEPPTASTPPTPSTEPALSEPPIAQPPTEPAISEQSTPNPVPPTQYAPVVDAVALFAQADGYTEGALTGALARTEGDVTYLAVPLRAGEPFPLMPIFCFGEPEQIDGADYLVFKLKDGVLHSLA